jgi:putative DNA primase/helicase
MNLTPDLREASRFLSTIAPDGIVTFQTFGEGTHKGDQRLSKIIHGHPNRCLEELAELNKRGAGVFLMVNQGDGNGRRSGNVQHVRAVFSDIDENGSQQLEMLDKLAAGAPRIVVESSPSRFQVYWLISGDLPLQYFKPIQKRFAELVGGDQAVCDLPRVMRVPGFFHQKAEPFLTRIVRENCEARPLPVLLLIKKAKALSSKKISTVNSADGFNKEFQITGTDQTIPRKVIEALGFISSELYDTWQIVGMCLHHQTEGNADGLKAWIDWSSSDSSFDESVCRNKWLTFGRHEGDRVSIGTIYHLAKENGWSNSQEEHLTDVGNGQRLARYFGEDLRYVPELGNWFVYENGLWQRDNDGHINRLAKKTTDRMIQEGRQMTDDEQRQRLMKHALASENSFRLKAMIDMAATEEGIVLHQEGLDRNPDLLGLSGGSVLNLRTGKTRAGQRDDFITKRCNIDVGEGVVSLAPSWASFLNKIMGEDEELIKYIQRAVGYSLTGHTSEQCLFFLYGTGANGKSTFLNVLQNLMGDYSIVIDPETIMSKNGGGGATPELARLKSARLLVTNEVEEGKHLAENRIKQMTGGDIIVARPLYREPFEFKPKFKIWMAGNHKPVIRGTDYAIWRRIHLIPFALTIPKEEQDKNLPQKLWNELPGILQWAVAGCKEWRKQGLNPPKQVRAAVDAYRDEMDTLGHWIMDCCLLDESSKTDSHRLYQSYKSWCQLNGHYPQSQTRFGRALGDRGMKKEKQGIVRWIGIGFKSLDSSDSFS